MSSVDWLHTAANLGAFLSALAAAVAIVVAIRTYKRQTNAQIFLEFTKRYDDTMASFQTAARNARLNLAGKPPEESEEVSLAVLRYLNLCSEEFYLFRRGYLATDIWGLWEAELKRTLGSPLFIREWKRLRSEFQSYPEFREYVDSTHAER